MGHGSPRMNNYGSIISSVNGDAPAGPGRRSLLQPGVGDRSDPGDG
jgi:hypothetical protein